jgi:hypothetical protein
VALYECRSLERMLVSHEVLMSTEVDPRPVDTAEQVLSAGKSCAFMMDFLFTPLPRTAEGQLLPLRSGRRPLPTLQERVHSIVAEAYQEDYWYAASRDGNRETHYRGERCLGPHWACHTCM